MNWEAVHHWKCSIKNAGCRFHLIYLNVDVNIWYIGYISCINLFLVTPHTLVMTAERNHCTVYSNKVSYDDELCQVCLHKQIIEIAFDNIHMKYEKKKPF